MTTCCSCPEAEHVLLDGEKAIPLQILSLNTGIGTFKFNMDDIATYLDTHNIAVMHVQEARVRPEQIHRVRALVKCKMPKYAMYIHGKPAGSKRSTAVLTLVRKELVQFLSPLSLTAVHDVLSGRILALKYAPPNVTTPLVLANLWMPDSSFPVADIRRAHESFAQLVCAWKTAGYSVIAAGDWNATINDTQRVSAADSTSDTGSLKVTDASFRKMLADTNLQPATASNEPTWESSNFRHTARLDHVLTTDRSNIQSCIVCKDVVESDHYALLTTLAQAEGCWNAGQHKPAARQERLDLTHLEDLAPEFARRLDEQQAALTDGLESLEEIMWDTAKEVFGLQKAGQGRKPFLNHVVTSSRKLIRTMRNLLRHYSREGSVDDPSGMWQKLQSLGQKFQRPTIHADFFESREGADIAAAHPRWTQMSSSDLKDLIRTNISGLRLEIRNEIHSMQRAKLAINMEKKRARLEKGKRGIQEAMGKQAAGARLSALRTTHPDTVSVGCINEEQLESVKVLCTLVDADCSFQESKGRLHCTASKLQLVYPVIASLTQERFAVELIPTSKVVDDPDDVLSALEHFMGREGKARGMVCPGCHTPELTCLSRVVENTRRIGWFCCQCNACCECVADDNVYNSVPWNAECSSDHRQVPDDTVYRLKGDVDWEDFKHLLMRMRNRKAPGQNKVASELWKHAPEWAQRILHSTINNVLSGAPMPDHWRGGTVQLLFKKLPYTELSNWRPVCLLNVSYRLFTSIVTRRLNRMVEHHGILDEAQEAFRFRRGTRRHFEAFMCAIRAAKRQGSSIVVSYLDFRNAFNSIDIQACLKILRAYNIPDVDLLEEMYKEAYYSFRIPNGSHTARIPLTRGTKQGDPASPLIFNLTINMLFRMMARSGHAFKAILRDGLSKSLRSLNCKAYADDTTTITHDVHSTNALLEVVASFCEYSGMELRPDKCEITGYNFGTKQPIDVSAVQYKGTALPTLRPGKATKCLGVHISLSLDWSTEKQYVMQKMKNAVAHLHNTCYTRSQIMNLFRICVVPIFRYSAPLVPWTAAELLKIDRLWSRAVKYSLRLPLSFASAPVFLSRSHGGLGLEPAANFMLKEVQIHVGQCFAFTDVVQEWSLDAALECMHRLGLRRPEDLLLLSNSRAVQDELAATPAFRMHGILQHTYWNHLEYLTMRPPILRGLAIALPIQKLRETGHNVHACVDKVLIAFHSASIYTVEQLTAGCGWNFTSYNHLPGKVKAAFPSIQYTLFQQCLLQSAAAKSLLFKKKPDLAALFADQQPAVHAAAPPDELPQLKWMGNPFLEMEGLYWNPEDIPPGNTNCLGELVCKLFQAELYCGVVVAQSGSWPLSNMIYRVAYEDGDSEDLDAEQLQQAVTLFVSQEEDALLERLALADGYKQEWLDHAPARLREERLKIGKVFEGLTCFVMIPAEHGNEGHWSEYCYRRIVDNQVGPVILVKQQLDGLTLADHPQGEQSTWALGQQLGTHTKVDVQEGVVTAVEASRLEKWFKGAFGSPDITDKTYQPLSTDKSKVTAYFACETRAAKAVFPLSVHDVTINPAPAYWDGNQVCGRITFDWTSMTPTLEALHPFLRVTRTGRWTFYKMQEPQQDHPMATGKMSASQQKRAKAHYQMLGVMDLRIGKAVMALAASTTPWSALVNILPPLEAADKAEDSGRPKPRHLHWLFAEHLRSISQASQFVGSPPTACAFGFSRVVYTREAQPFVFTDMEALRTVAWIDGLSKEMQKTHWPKLLKLPRTTPSVIVVSAGIRRELEGIMKLQPPRWTLIHKFPKGSRLMLAKAQFDFNPRASALQLEVWTNFVLSRDATESIRQFQMPAEPLQTLQDMTGGRWEAFQSGSQDFKYRNSDGIVAATDGAVFKDKDEGIVMGGGVAFRRDTPNQTDQFVRVNGHVSTLVAEGAAVSVLLAIAPVDQPLTILTDSANVMFAMQHCSRKELQRDFSNHTDEQLIQNLAKAQAARTAPTHWVKVKSHTSVELNERADRLAGEAPFAPDNFCRFFSSQADPNFMSFHSRNAEGAEVQATSQELKDHFIQIRNAKLKSTRAELKLMYEGVGRHFLHDIVWAESGAFTVCDKTRKQMLQCLTNTFPVQKRLYVMGKVKNATCPFCTKNVDETLYHWQQLCPNFADARTKVHNDVWQEVYSLLKTHMSDTWQCCMETPMGQVQGVLPGSILRTSPVSAVRQPDGLFYQASTNTWLLVDYTRSGGSSRPDLVRSENAKRVNYTDLMEDLQELNTRDTFVFYPLASSYNGAVACDTWTELMTRLELDDAKQTLVLKTAVREIGMGFATMADIRSGAILGLRTQNEQRVVP